MTVVLAPPLLLIKDELANCPTAAILCTLELQVIVWNSAYVTTTYKQKEYTML